MKSNKLPIYYVCAVFLSLLGQLSDCITTDIGLTHGAKEGNPFMIYVVHHVWLEYPLKIILSLIFSYISYRIFHFKRKGALVALIPAVTGFAAAIWNISIICR